MPVPNRETISRRVRKKLDSSSPPFLPMPHPVMGKWASKKVTCGEWEEYQERRRRHEHLDPSYEVGFARPMAQTADGICAAVAQVSGLSLTTLLPEYKWFGPLDRDYVQMAAKQALVVALDTCVHAGLNHRVITFNVVFDALAARWSDNYRASPARTVRDMREDTAKRCRRDLLLHGISLKRVWKVIAGPWSETNGPNPLFWVKRLSFGGRQVFLKEDGPEVEQFRRLMDTDPNYQGHSGGQLKVLFADQEPPAREAEHDMAAEVPYNEVRIGRRAEEMLRLQEQAQLILDARVFREDYERARTQEHELQNTLAKTYGVDPRMSNVRRWITEDPAARSERPRLTRTVTSGGRVRERRERENWSPRERYVFYRSIEEGLRRASRPDDRRLEAECQKLLNAEKDSQRWKRHLASYVKWLTEERGSRRRVSTISLKDVVKANLVTRRWREEVRDLLVQYDRARTHVAQYRKIYEQIAPFWPTLDDFLAGLVSKPRQRRTRYLPIRSGLYRLTNRRYQPAHFWPTLVTAKNTAPEAQAVAEGLFESCRKRWFKARGPDGEVCKLVGWDISSSQTQIVAILFGLDQLQHRIFSEKKSIKEVLAEEAWRRHLDHGDAFELRNGRSPYSGPTDKRLQELVKTLWMRTLYGSSAYRVVIEQQGDRETYGPGWTVKNAQQFLDDQQDFPRLKQFLEACRQLAKVAFERDPYDGVRFTDPFDRADVRWNPVERHEVPVESEGQKLLLLVPGTLVPPHRPTRFQRAKSNARGDYPVDRNELRKMVGPCLVHMLDAYFSALVMARLAAQGVHDFVGIHDCWLLPEQIRLGSEIVDGRTVLRETIDEVSSEWHAGLGSIYKDLLRYLGKDEHFGPLIRRLKQTWKKRVAIGWRPSFVCRDSS